MYTTGEMAKLCGVTVRTVQFYDGKGILIPSELTEGGRRLYNDADLKKLQFICMLKSLGLGLEAIKGVLESENSTFILSTLLDDQLKQLQAEVDERQKQLDRINLLKNDIKELGYLSVKKSEDIEERMQERKNEKKLQTTFQTTGAITDIGLIIGLICGIKADNWLPLIAVGIVWAMGSTALMGYFYSIRSFPSRLLASGGVIGIVIEISLIAGIICGFKLGNWLALILAVPLWAVMIAAFFSYYYRHAKYICPQCRESFKPKKLEYLFASHTMKTRKLTCTVCGTKDWCIERFGEELKNEVQS